MHRKFRFLIVRLSVKQNDILYVKLYAIKKIRLKLNHSLHKKLKSLSFKKIFLFESIFRRGGYNIAAILTKVPISPKISNTTKMFL